MALSRPFRQSLRRGTLVVTAAQAVSQVVTLAVLAAMYRLLGLEPYGLVGMVVPLLLLVRILIASGLDVATIQEAELSERQVSALFWLNQALGAAMTLATAACAPLLAWLYGIPQLAGLTLAMAGTSLVTALGTQHQALLQRRLRLGTLAVVRLAAQAAAGLAGVLCAWAGWGVWALVVQQYVEPAVLAVLAWSAEPWRPRFAVRGAAAGGLVRFGGHYTVSSLMFYLVANADKVLIGVALGPAPLALYSQAFNLMMRPVNVVIGPMLGIMLPALSRAAPERRQFGELLLGFFRFTALVMFPAAVGLAIVAPEAMRVLGGPRWAPAGPILAVLALALLVQGFFNALGSVLASAGRADRLAYASMVVAAVLCAGFFVGLHLGTLAGQPLLGVAAAYTLGMVVIVFPAYVWFALRTVGVGNWSWLRRLGPAAMATLVMAGAVVACRTLLLRVAGLPDLGLLAIEIVVGVLVYVFVAGREIRWFLRRK